MDHRCVAHVAAKASSFWSGEPGATTASPPPPPPKVHDRRCCNGEVLGRSGCRLLGGPELPDGGRGRTEVGCEPPDLLREQIDRPAAFLVAIEDSLDQDQGLGADGQITVSAKVR